MSDFVGLETTVLNTSRMLVSIIITGNEAPEPLGSATKVVAVREAFFS